MEENLTYQIHKEMILMEKDLINQDQNHQEIIQKVLDLILNPTPYY